MSEQQDPAPVISMDEWLRQFAINAGPRISKDERMKLTFIAGTLRGKTEALDETIQTRDVLAGMLDTIARTIKGEPEPGCVWGFEDLPELVAALVAKGKGLH